MDTLIIARHGHDNGRYLSETGQAQISRLCDRLLPDMNGSVLVLSSTTDRARESAEIIAKAFSAEIELHKVLWSENDHPMDLDGALAVIREREPRADVIVVVTHYEYVVDLPAHYATKVLGGSNFPRKLIDKGQAWVIDCDEKTIKIV